MWVKVMVCVFEDDSDDVEDIIFFFESDLFVGYFVDMLVFFVLKNWDI